MLVMGAGNGDCLETLWEAGFDVTGQESDPRCLETARKRIGKRAELVLSSPDHLPFDDCAFDYAVVTPSFVYNPGNVSPAAVFEELGRLICNGVIILFPNAWSLFGIECRLRTGDPLCSAHRHLLSSPRYLSRTTRKIFGRKKTAWSSVLPASTHTWREGLIFSLFNSPNMPLPVGAFAGLRIDFGPLYTGTPIVLRATSPVTSAK